MIRIRVLGCFRKNEKLVTGIVQAIHKPARRFSGMRATPDLHQPVVNAHRHALIEDETLALPMLIPELLLIRHDPAMQLEDVLEATLAQQR